MRGVMRVIKRIGLPVVLLVAVTACERSHVLTPEEVGATPLSEIDSFAAEDRSAVKAAVDRLGASGVDAREFYLGAITQRSDGLRELPLWHRAAFEEPMVVGNPGGRSRTLVFDPSTTSIVEDLAWQ